VVTIARSTGRRPTQTDVARLAGVSQPVVSYVLGGAADAPVAPDTRDRVLAAIAELGYVPDRTARNLRRRRTSTLAGIIPDITNPYYPAFVRGVQDVAEAHGFDLIIYNTDGNREKERQALQSAREGRVEGVIVTPFHLELGDLLPLVADGITLVITGELWFDPIRPASTSSASTTPPPPPPPSATSSTAATPGSG
jgi:LacI family transcriptional regulator